MWLTSLAPTLIGADPESNASECQAVFVVPETGDFLFRLDHVAADRVRSFAGPVHHQDAQARAGQKPCRGCARAPASHHHNVEAVHI